MARAVLGVVPMFKWTRGEQKSVFFFFGELEGSCN